MVNWYPGHMAKTEKLLKQNIKLVDLIIEVLDARIPASSRTDQIKNIVMGKEHIIVLNKKDLADDRVTKEWKRYYKKKEQVITIAINALKKSKIEELENVINDVSEKINKKMINRGRKNRRIRVMAAGIPNVGKSALINCLAGSDKARTGNKPGVTRGKQWIKIANKIELLDTPGILSPDLENEEKAYKLAITGAINKKHYDLETAAYKFIEYVRVINKKIIEDYYKINIDEEQHSYDILKIIGRKRGCLMSGGKVDIERAAKTILTDYQKNNIASISLETPSGGE